MMNCKAYAKIPAILVILATAVSAGVIPSEFSIGSKLSKSTAFPDSVQTGLQSNVISDIRLQNDTTVWLGTGRGLTKLHRRLLNPATFYTNGDLVNNTRTDLLPEGGISALAVTADRVAVAVAGQLNDVSAGMGIAITDSASGDWLYYSQPVDGEADSLENWQSGKYFATLPVTVSEQNISYDAHISGDYLWIASWAGGVRRYSFADTTWQRIPLPLDNQPELKTCQDALYDSATGILDDYFLNPRDPAHGGNHNHKGFAVLAYGDTVWVGTANGINRGIMSSSGDCIDWEHYFYPMDGLSGNWVVSLAKQDWNGQRIIWAVTINTAGSEERGLSYTKDDGATWHSTLLGERAYNVTAVDSLVFASTENGLWRSNDGQNWALYKPAIQSLALDSVVYLTDEITTNTVYSAMFDSTNEQLWIGTGDGVARADNLDGLNWRILRSESEGDYVYPNPFYSSNNGDSFVRFKIDVKKSHVINMNVFDFAMQQVYQEEFDRRESDMGAIKWNGQDKNGRMVANGTYFIRLEYDYDDHWFKLIVVK